MPTGDPYCSVHGLIRCECGTYKQSYQVQRRLIDVSDKELITAWWCAFKRTDFPTNGGIECDVALLRNALDNILN